jgi:hypothetical protein
MVVYLQVKVVVVGVIDGVIDSVSRRLVQNRIRNERHNSGTRRVLGKRWWWSMGALMMMVK